MPYLITGATGNIGGRVVERLLALGHRPRVLVRDLQKARSRFGDRLAISVGDLSDPASLVTALDGIEAVFLVNVGTEIPTRDEAVAAAAKAAGVQCIVKLSSMDVLREGGSAVGAWHAKGEDAIRASGIACTFVQPAGFMSNALGWATTIKKDGVVRASTGAGKIAMIHPDDIAAVAVEALVGRTLRGASVAITGPVALSYREMTDKIGAAIGRSIAFEPISDQEARERMLLTGAPPVVVDALVSLWRAIREDRVSQVTYEVERVTGRKPTTFDQWVKENAAAFR